MSELTKENAYRRWKKGEDPHKLAKEMGTTRERMRHILKKMDASVPLVDRIEELEAKLAKAVEALEQIASHRKKCHEYDDDVGHERREFDVEDMIIMEYAARTTLAELKGQDDE